MQKRDDDTLLIVEHLTMEYHSARRLFEKPVPPVRAVNDVSFSVKPGETFGIVGESGCGKTTLGKCIVRLLKPGEGRLLFRADGEMKDLLQLSRKDSFSLRRKIQIIFQDPYASLNPMHTIFEAFDEPLRVHGIGGSKRDREELIAESLRKVNLQPEYMYRYPHEFSGGQRQRICIAKALVLGPDLIVCDEPVSALDVSVQAQILNLMSDLQEEMGISYLFIAHGMPVVQHISRRVGVMYLGHLVETADSAEIFRNSLHPYTQALMSAIPIPDPGARRERKLIRGEVPNLMNAPRGCLFAGRCDRCTQRCREEIPQLREAAPGHQVACHLITEG